MPLSCVTTSILFHREIFCSSQLIIIHYIEVLKHLVAYFHGGSRWVAQANKLQPDWQPPTNHGSHLAPAESMNSLIGPGSVTSGCKIALIGRINMTTRITWCLIGCKMWRRSRGVGPGRDEAQYPSRNPAQLPEWVFFTPFFFLRTFMHLIHRNIKAISDPSSSIYISQCHSRHIIMTLHNMPTFINFLSTTIFSREGSGDWQQWSTTHGRWMWVQSDGMGPCLPLLDVQYSPYPPS